MRATAWLSASAQVSESRLFFVDFAMRALRVLVLLSIWRLLVEQNPSASPMALPALLTYTVIAEAFSRAINLSTGLADAFWQGSLVNYFMRPVGVVRQFAAESLGTAAVDFVLFSVPLLLIAPLLGVGVAPASLGHGALFALSLALSISVGLAIEFIAGAISLLSDQPIWLVEFVRRAITRLLSGALVPLAILPFGLGEIFAWLPFAATAWAPLAIYTGVEAPVPLLARQLLWALALWPLALGLWRRNRERVVAYGG